MPKVAIIAGSGLEASFGAREKQVVTTPYGEAAVQSLVLPEGEVILMPRHGLGHTVPPHRVNYRANVWALSSSGVTTVIATNAVGSLRRSLKPGHFVVPHQLIDFTKQRPSTFFDGQDGRVVHTDVTEVYDRGVREALVRNCRTSGTPTHDGGVYVCTEGPRYETPAEVSMFRVLGGDVVGMTGSPEAFLSKEVGLAYASLCVVTNYAAGLQMRVSHDEVVELMRRRMPQLKEVVLRTASELLCGSAGPTDE